MIILHQQASKMSMVLAKYYAQVKVNQSQLFVQVQAIIKVFISLLLNVAHLFPAKSKVQLFLNITQQNIHHKKVIQLTTITIQNKHTLTSSTKMLKLIKKEQQQLRIKLKVLIPTSINLFIANTSAKKKSNSMTQNQKKLSIIGLMPAKLKKHLMPIFHGNKHGIHTSNHLRFKTTKDQN